MLLRLWLLWSLWLLQSLWSLWLLWLLWSLLRWLIVLMFCFSLLLVFVSAPRPVRSVAGPCRWALKVMLRAIYQGRRGRGGWGC